MTKTPNKKLSIDDLKSYSIDRDLEGLDADLVPLPMPKDYKPKKESQTENKKEKK